MGMFFFDTAGMLLLIPAMILSFYAQMKVSSTFKKYSEIANKKSYTGADVARQLLISSGIYDVTVEHTAGNLTDHYDPRSKVIRLSDSVYNSTSIAALSVAAHETGHAAQHNQEYLPLSIRSGIFPVVNIGSTLSTPLIIAGILMSSAGGTLGLTLLYAGIILFSVVVMFQVVTLPVEFNASSRALAMLEDHNFLTNDEIKPAKKVLNAAALTYVAAAIVAIANLIRFVLIAASRRDD